ncbi:MAG: TlpA family protein disulfide reductase [Gemmatimonadetes bacterium]|nr:TlpA family protein disulfide reductase [Gemmatimonadota bacterium]MYD15455.1 TlpA family protein disulfide reductase [Gemmatimonadota bacterium]MYI67140.1 TlpA family protein disulfide reductase [Gemmatimonadota bacterium]
MTTPRRRWFSGSAQTILGCLIVVLAACSFPSSDDSVLAPGELRFTPEAPAPGAPVAVRYAPPAALAGEAELVLRGHYRTDGDEMYNHTYNDEIRNERIAILRPASGGIFTAGFVLPDSAVYAAFAVEDPAGQRLDADGGALFELLMRAGDGKPLFHALMQRANDFAGRNWIAAYESNRRAVELYPDSLDGWFRLRGLENLALGATGSDSLAGWHRENLARIQAGYAGRDSLTWETMRGIRSYAERLGDSTVAQFWAQRIDALPSNPFQRSAADTYFRWLDDRDSQAALQAYEESWPAARGQNTQLAEFALRVGIDAGDLAAVDRWTDRTLEEGRSPRFVANWLIDVPERGDRAVELVRESLFPSEPEPVDLAVHPGRPLGRTVSEYARLREAARATTLVTYSRFLERAGRLEAAIDTLEDAGATLPSSDLHRRLGDMRLSLGDSAGAASDYAFVAADPRTTGPGADSLAALVGLAPEESRWRFQVQTSRTRLLGHAATDTVRWTPPPSRVRDAAGTRWSMAELVAARPTVLVFWARSCGPCIAEIPEVARLRNQLEPEGVQVLSITVDDLPGPGMDEFIEARGVTYPVYYDLEREASNAFGVSAIPANFVLDSEGNVRFAYTEIEQVQIQLAALRRAEGVSR